MDPPVKFPPSPGMSTFAVSPERVNGTRPPYGAEDVPQSPSLPDLTGRMSPLRNLRHRRNDSNASLASVHELTSRFECLEVTDLRDAQEQFRKTLEKVKSRHASTLTEAKNKHEQQLQREQMAREDLAERLKRAQDSAQEELNSFKEEYAKRKDEFRKEREKIEQMYKQERQTRKKVEAVNVKLDGRVNELQSEKDRYKQEYRKTKSESLALSGKIPELQTKLRSTQSSLDVAKVNLTTARDKADHYQHEAHTLEIQLKSVQMQYEEEVKRLQEQMKLVEEERDALKTNLKEEEVLRIAAEGRIALPATTEEDDEFASPRKAPRKSLTIDLDSSDDKENVSPKKKGGEFKLLQQELKNERRLRERAEEQIDFMKMECQFQCCSCRVAEFKGANYIHDDSYATEMEKIKATVPVLTPPASHHEDEMEGIVIKQEPLEDERPLTPPEEPTPEPAHESATVEAKEPEEEQEVEAEPKLTFSPTTGTFRSVSSSTHPAPATSTTPPPVPHIAHLARITEASQESSPWAPAAEEDAIRTSTISPPPYQARPASRISYADIPEEVIEDEENDENDENAEPPSEPQTPLHGPFAALTPHNYLTRTITTTTTIPLHFSPLTPANQKSAKLQPPTPSTIAHMPSHTQSSQPLGDISLNKLPIDREAALEQIRQRRGRARSLAAGQSTPRKQMIEGVVPGGRRDISAPVGRVRR